MRRETCISTQSESRALLARALPLPIGRGLWQALWRGRSVRAQLLIVFVLIDVVAGLIAGAVTILHARTSTRVEIAASMQLARLLMSEAVALMQQEVPAEKFLADLDSRLRPVRHVRIVVRDATGLPLLSQSTATGRETVHEAQAPGWFAALIAPEIESRNVPVVIKGQRIGSVEIVAEPSDEIAEVWTNSVALGAVALLVNVAVIGMLYFLFGRVLDPLTGVARGLGDLEQRNYRVRLPRPQARELAVITDRFNALAHALEAARSENDQLNHRLISAQDDERRRTARELHDEVGPCLFGLKANAGSIQTASAALPDPIGGRLVERARDMLAIIEQLQVINRRLLNRLRPMALGHFPLRDILAELVNESAHRDPRVGFSLTAERLDRSYGDSMDLTVYRCLQESLTNIARHAQAKRVRIELGEGEDTPQSKPGMRCLHLSVQDDGCGFDPAGRSPGFGIRGMQERVHGLGGRFILESGRGRGTCVRIAIPLHQDRNAGDRRSTVGRDERTLPQ